MTTTPPEAPTGPPAGDGGHERPDGGPRVTRDDVRDLARLRRSSSDRKVAGVAGGLARFFDIDPVIVRVGLVVLTLFGGAGLLVYGALWLIVPEEGTERTLLYLDNRTRSIALIGIGVVSLLSLVGDSWGFWGFPWQLVVVGVIVLLVMNSRDRGHRVSLTKQAPGPASATGWVTPGQPAGAAPYDPSYAAAYAAPYVAPPRPRDPRRRGPILFWFTLALIALALGTLGVADLSGADVTASVYPGLALGITGFMLVVGAFYGRAGGLILIGLLTTLALFGTSVGEHWSGGRIDETPTKAADVDQHYWLGTGEVVIDLSNVTDLAALDDRTLEIGVGAGRVEIVVPDDMDVTVDGEVGGPGDVSVFGRHADGINPNIHSFSEGGVNAPDLRIKAFAGTGEIEVTQR